VESARAEAVEARRSSVGGQDALLSLAELLRGTQGLELEPMIRLAASAEDLRSALAGEDRSAGGDASFNAELLQAAAEAWRFAVFFGRERPGAEELLIGLLWDRSTWAAQLGLRAGLTFEDVFTGLSGWKNPPPALAPLSIPTSTGDKKSTSRTTISVASSRSSRISCRPTRRSRSIAIQRARASHQQRD
jgi:hypothetical protein